MFVYIRSAAFVIVVTQKLVLQQSKNVTAKFTETLSPPPPIIQYLLGIESIGNYILCTEGHSKLRLHSLKHCPYRKPIKYYSHYF